MKLLSAAGAFALAFLILAVPALAADPNTVVVPAGDWIATAATWLQGTLTVVLLALITAAARFLPASLQSYNTAANRAVVEQLLEKAVGFALNKVEGAAKGKTLDINVGSSVLATAAQYAVDHGPAKIIAWAGGADALLEKILARLDLEPGVDGAAVLANSLVPAAK